VLAKGAANTSFKLLVIKLVLHTYRPIYPRYLRQLIELVDKYSVYFIVFTRNFGFPNAMIAATVLDQGFLAFSQEENKSS
jgi:adenine/guanine phosphoribosyltransferase-like PRPP-binding protein